MDRCIARCGGGAARRRPSPMARRKNVVVIPCPSAGPGVKYRDAISVLATVRGKEGFSVIGTVRLKFVSSPMSSR